MTEWHKTWQSKFDNVEITFPNINGTVTKYRKADAMVDNIVIEFQHSKISNIEVDNRKKDYLLYGKKILWVVDINDSVENQKITIKYLQNKNTYLINFIHDIWKYENFKNEDILYLSYNKYVFKVNPKKIKSGMIDIMEKYEDSYFIKLLNNKNEDEIFTDIELYQCKLYYNQRGAGCGKTYESIQLLTNSYNKINQNKKIFIYLTKMHSAKEVIYDELINQYENKKLKSISIINGGDADNDSIGKQYKIKYKKNDIGNNMENEENTIIIGTIDSFMYALHEPKNIKNVNNYFVEIISSLSRPNKYPNKVDKSGKININYARNNIRLCKECLVIIDESQDLQINYLNAMVEIMRNTYIDVYMIGDKLQSITYENNIYTMLENIELPNIDVIKSEKINRIRRFHNTQFKDFVNNLINFSKFDLPEIESVCGGDCNYIHSDNVPYNVFKICNFHETDKDIISKHLNALVKYMDNEVIENNYKPNNFMFIVPYCNSNPFMDLLEVKIQKYWISKNTNNQQDKYKKYVVFHKSDEGKSINLKESTNSVRIVSIHTSKGQGREVIFVLGISENTLNMYSKGTNNLIYESLLHVSLTRQKQKLYVGLDNIHDDIYDRFKKNNIKIKYINPRYEIRKKCKIEYIISYILSDKKLFGLNGNLKDVEIIGDTNNKHLIDMGHHLIRSSVIKYHLMVYVANYGEKKQIEAIHHMLKGVEVSIINENIYLKKLYNLTKNIRNINNKSNYVIFLIIFESKNKSIYNRYNSIIKSIINNIRKKIKLTLFPKFCVLETVIILHIIQLNKMGKYLQIRIIDIYNLIFSYSDTYNNLEHLNHSEYGCLCDTLICDIVNNDIINKQINNDIVNHYEILKKLEILYKRYQDHILYNITDTESFNYLIYHDIYFKNNNGNFMLHNNCTMITYSDSYVINVIIKPQFNKMNCNEILIQSILQEFIIKNCKKNENCKRFNNKKIYTCIIALNLVEPLFICHDIKHNDENIINIINNFIQKKFDEYNEDIIKLYNHVKDNLIIENKNNKTNIKSIDRIIKTIDNSITPESCLSNIYLDYFKSKNTLIKSNQKNQTINILKDNSLMIDDMKKYVEEQIYDFLDIDIDEDDNFY